MVYLIIPLFKLFIWYHLPSNYSNWINFTNFENLGLNHKFFVSLMLNYIVLLNLPLPYSNQDLPLLNLWLCFPQQHHLHHHLFTSAIFQKQLHFILFLHAEAAPLFPQYEFSLAKSFFLLVSQFSYFTFLMHFLLFTLLNQTNL